MRDRLRRLVGEGDRNPRTTDCRCQQTSPPADGELVVDASDCPGAGRLATEPDCRETVTAALSDTDAAVVRVVTGGTERVYEGDSAAALSAAGRFGAAVERRDERLARLARRDPLRGAREAVGRAGPIAEIARETGFDALADETDGASRKDGTGESERDEQYASLFAPSVEPTVSRWRVDPDPPAGASLLDCRELSTASTVRRYRTSEGPDRYHLEPPVATLSPAALDALGMARDRLEAASGEETPRQAVRAVTGPDSRAGTLERILTKHTRGRGLLEDLFADPAVSDVFVTPPPGTPVRVTVDGDRLETNLAVTPEWITALESSLRLESGRPFSRATPTLDAQIEIAGRTVRVAGVTEPTSDGTGFALRAHDSAVWTLAKLLARDSLSATAAGLLSCAVERGRSVLLAGPRGAGKTTTLGALLWEIPRAVRQVLIEDTPELPVSELRAAGRDIQRLETGSESLSPTQALRTALRLGNGALVVGEVRGEEAQVLYEAMRVGANSEAVLGTIHGSGAASVRERVVTDLGVAPTAFAATDLVVTLGIVDGTRCVTRIEELCGPESFASLCRREDGRLVSTGRIERGNSRFLAALAGPAERYADIRDRLTERSQTAETLSEQGRTETPAVRADSTG